MAKSVTQTVYTREDGHFEAIFEISGGPGITKVNASAGLEGGGEVASGSAQPASSTTITAISGSLTDGGPHGSSMYMVNVEFTVTPPTEGVELTITSTVVGGTSPGTATYPVTFATDSSGTFSQQFQFYADSTSVSMVASALGVESAPATFIFP